MSVLQKTGAIEEGVRNLARAHQSSPWVRRLTIPNFMVLFSPGGAIFGMAEEVIPFILIFVPLALALEYDTMTGIAIPFIGAGAGFAGAFFNPFTVGVAQGIAELPLFSGLTYRVICWAIVTLVAIVFVMRHAAKVKRDPALSLTYELDEKGRRQLLQSAGDADESITWNHKAVLIIFALGILTLVYGVLEKQ